MPVWSTFGPSEKIGLKSVLHPMIIKGFARSCLGDMFKSEKEVEELSSAYHVCWGEMEVRGL